jgi:hypothetical protein
VTLHPDWTVHALVQSWKLFTARRINAALGQRGTLWQKDYFDRIIRDEDHFWRAASYIRANPAKGKLRAGEYLLWESAEVKATLDAEEAR